MACLMRFFVFVLIACFARCTSALSKHASQHDNHDHELHNVLFGKDHSHPQKSRHSTREQDLDEIRASTVDWNIHLLEEAPHHQLLVKNRKGGEYMLHWYETEMGNVTQGDILLEPEYLEYLLSHDGREPPVVDMLGVASTRSNQRWPCPIAYTINPGLPNQRRVTEAIAHLEEYTSYRFVPRSNQQSYMEFTPSSGCSSFIGRVRSGRQNINLAQGCETAATAHEIMHALGIFHEQSRSDRNDFVSINFANVQQGFENNFNQAQFGTDIGAYDFGSIMHYGLRDFAINRQQNVINPRQVIPDTACFVIGQRVMVSETDVQTIDYVYNAQAAERQCAGATTPDYNPCGQQSTMQVCGGGNSWNGVYKRDGELNGKDVFIRHPWNRRDRFILNDGNRWCLSTSRTRCSQGARGDNTETADNATYSGSVSVSNCGNGVVNPCASAPCQNGGTCTAQGNSYICSCSNLWAGQDCEIADNDCSPNPCQNGGTCSDGASNPNTDDATCTCPTGFQGSRCEIEPDPCRDSPCQNGGQCNPTGATTFTCACSGFWTGPTCEESTDSCFDNPCENGGTCIRVDNGNSFQCQCPPEWRGGRCQVADNDCAPNPCENGGTCTDIGIEEFECDCPDMFTGPTCAVSVEPCTQNPCENGGTCVVQGGDIEVCECPNTWRGSVCEIADDDCSPNPCQNGGLCQDIGLNQFRCFCETGWEGTTCTENIDDCSANPCRNGGRCVDGLNTFTCECPTGFIGDVCETDVDDCVGNQCQNGQCVDGPNSYQCNCNPGFQGEFCDQAINGCSPNPCQNNGGCAQPQPGVVECTCPRGWTGTLCNIDQDDCVPNPCQNGGFCSDMGLNTYECTCPPEFIGDDCELQIRATTLPSTNPPTRPTTPDNTISPDSAQSDTVGGQIPEEIAGVPTAAIGGAVGGIILLLIVAIVILLWRRRSKGVEEDLMIYSHSDYGNMIGGAGVEGFGAKDAEVVELSMSDEHSVVERTSAAPSSHVSSNRPPPLPTRPTMGSSVTPAARPPPAGARPPPMTTKISGMNVATPAARPPPSPMGARPPPTPRRATMMGGRGGPPRGPPPMGGRGRGRGGFNNSFSNRSGYTPGYGNTPNQHWA